MADEKRDADVGEAALLRPRQANERSTNGLVAIDAHYDQHVRGIVNGHELQVGDHATGDVATIENVVVLAPQEHGEHIAEAYVDVGQAQMKNEEIHA